VVADDHNGDIGRLGRVRRRIVVVVQSEIHLDSRTDLILDSI